MEKKQKPHHRDKHSSPPEQKLPAVARWVGQQATSTAEEQVGVTVCCRQEACSSQELKNPRPQLLVALWVVHCEGGKEQRNTAHRHLQKKKKVNS